jgi:hypothetical protein
MSGSFVFTDIGTDHGGGPAFDPVVKFVNRYRARPRRVADRVFLSCGVYEPLIIRNRSMVPTSESAGMEVRRTVGQRVVVLPRRGHRARKRPADREVTAAYGPTPRSMVRSQDQGDRWQRWSGVVRSPPRWPDLRQ